VPGYIYAATGDAIYVNLFVASEANIELQDNAIHVKQITGYPWEGQVQIEVFPTHEAEFGMFVRIPGWAQNRPVPGDLYHYMETYKGKPTLAVNGEAMDLDLVRGYARILRTWKDGDVIMLELPMPVRRVQSHPNVVENTGKIALERGPLVYCVEGIDHDGEALNLILPENAECFVEYDPDFLEGLVVIKGKAFQSGKIRELTAIPYYAWSHRGVGEMTVWLDREK